MSKEVRLNDKFWYGKYKGRTIKFILDIDRNFLDVLISKNRITYNKNVNEYLEKSGRKYKWYENPPDNQVDELQGQPDEPLDEQAIVELDDGPVDLDLFDDEPTYTFTSTNAFTVYTTTVNP